MTLEQQLTRGPARAARARLGLRCGCLVAKAVRLHGGGDAAVSTCMRGRLPTGLRARSTPHRIRQRLACVRAPRRRSWNFWPRGTRGERIPPGTLHAIGARASVSTAMAGGWDRTEGIQAPTCMQSGPQAPSLDRVLPSAEQGIPTAARQVGRQMARQVGGQMARQVGRQMGLERSICHRLGDNLAPK